ncbi:MAG: LptF/LptG family permease [Pirellulales bacterium]|nr:LptF/LptG family permease [Pirellulales bacterium]
MTKIDRYILTLFLRTVIVCFCSVAGIFIVFHAFNSMDDLVKQGHTDGGLTRVMLRYYGPYMLLLFDWTAAIITLMSMLFTVGWLRRTGELTATLAAGVSHGRILRPMILASTAIIGVQLVNRECVLPGFRDTLSMKARDIAGKTEQPILAKYDKMNRVLIDGTALVTQERKIRQPSFRLSGDYPGFGDRLAAHSAQWVDANQDHPAGYLLRHVRHPEHVDTLPSVAVNGRSILMTRRDHDWLQPGQCFFATSVDTDLLQSNQNATRYASLGELVGHVRNPAVYSSLGLHVLLHERIIRPPLDFSLVLMGLPLVVNRRGRNLFVMIAIAMFTVLIFFAVKTLAGAMGGSGYLLTPSLAAWVPLLLFGPLAYTRLRDVQTV